MVVIMEPCRREMLRLGQGREQILIQKLVAHFAVKALGESVFLWLARRDVMPFDAMFQRPLQNDAAGQFGSVIADDTFGDAASYPLRPQ